MDKLIDTLNEMPPQDFEKFCLYLANEFSSSLDKVKEVLGNMQECFDDQD